MAADAIMSKVTTAANRTSFGPYLLGKTIGGGLCYEAIEAWPQNDPQSAPAVLKRIARHVRDPAITDAFIVEQKHSMLFDHSHLAKAKDRGDVDNQHYIVFPFYGSRSLNIASDSIQLLSQVAQAIDAMHASDILHCDVTPDNIVLSDSDHATLIDFSAASPANQKQATPQGTYPYMSPEQVKGEVLTHHTDQFSLGTMAWEMLTKRRLFARNEPHLSMMAVVDEEIPPTTLGTSLDEILSKALSKKPNKRFDSCAEFVDALLLVC